MPITHVNAKGQTYYLHQGTTKTGKPKYHFAMKSVGRPKMAKKDPFSYPECGPRHQVPVSASVLIQFRDACPPELRYPGQPDSRASNARGDGP